MKTRIIAGLAMVPLLLVVYLGGYFLYAACFILSIFAVREFYQAFENASEEAEITKPVKPSFIISLISIIILYTVVLLLDLSFLSLWICVTSAICFTMLFNHGKHKIIDVFVTIVGNIYIVFFLFHIVLIAVFFSVDSASSIGTNGLSVIGLKNPIWFVFLTAFGSDIFAYFAGVTLGKHKLCPSLSPKKTVEGLIGGILGSTALCGVYAYFALPELFIHGLIIGAVGAGVATMGDLTASAIKRKLDIKDYGHLIPGHGGILDRFDSVLFTGPFVFFYLQSLLFIRVLIAS